MQVMGSVERVFNSFLGSRHGRTGTPSFLMARCPHDPKTGKGPDQQQNDGRRLRYRRHRTAAKTGDKIEQTLDVAIGDAAGAVEIADSSQLRHENLGA